MRLLLWAFAIFFIILSDVDAACAQSGSNMGTEFYTTFADHIYQAGSLAGAIEVPGTSYMVIYITSDQNATGNIDFTNNGTSLIPFFVGANKTAALIIPPSAFLSNLSGVAQKKAIHIKSDKNVAVYAEIYGSTTVGVTAAAMVLPVTALGTDYKSINFTQTVNSFAATEGNAYSFLDVIATADNTQIEITPSAPIFTGDPAAAGTTTTVTPFTLVLNKGDVYQALSVSDLTGTRVRSVAANGSACNPVAVFSGSTKIYIGNSVSNCTTFKTSDNLFQQVYPTAAWGNHFITVPFKGRESAVTIYRVILSDNSTNVSITPAPTYQQNDPSKGYLEFSSAQPLVITADKPVQAVQYALTQFISSCNLLSGDLGDPEMIYLTPVEQGVKSASFYSTGRYAIDPNKNFINVVLPATATSSFRLDGNALPANTFTPVTANPVYAYAQIPVLSGSTYTTVANTNNGSHYIIASQPFTATAYGFGNYESYGYAVAGQFNLLNRAITLQDPVTGSNLQTAGCSGKGYTPVLTLPFAVSQITWKVDGTVINVQQNLQALTTQNNDQTLYTYQYLNTVANTPLVYFGGAGTHTITASIKTPYSDCEEDVAYSVTLQNAPVPVFTPANSCIGDLVTFTLTTPSDASSISSVSWNFGDNNSSGNTAGNTISHTYNSPGTYPVIATVNYANGCTIVSTPQPVNITDKPIADFRYSSLNCTGSDIVFTDASDAKGSVIKWAWDFGDGIVSALQNPAHSYLNANTYQVKLIITNVNGCTSAKQYPVIVNALPIVNITQPNPLCQETAPFQIITDKNGFLGTETFTGEGVTITGLFDPAKAGPGIHTINYIFTAQTGCTYTRNFDIVVYYAPDISVGPDVKILEGDAVKLIATATGNNLSYKWYPSDGLNRDDILNPVASPLNDTKYILTVTSGTGCINSANISVTVLKTPKILNTFTPNGDGVNDLWYIDLLSSYPQATVNVYNRNGEKVFSSVGYSIPWDGKFNGADLPTGVYFYIVNLNNGRKPIAGNVTIIR